MAKSQTKMELAGLGEMEAALGRSPELREYLVAKTAEVMKKAEELAGERVQGHRNADDKRGESYEKSFVTAIRPDGKYIAGVIANTAYDAVWVELGVHPRGGETLVPGRHVLQDALRAVAGTEINATVKRGQIDPKLKQARRRALAKQHRGKRA